MAALLTIAGFAAILAYLKSALGPMMQPVPSRVPIILSEQCSVIPGAEGCEELRYNDATGLIYMACSNYKSRYTWFPPLALFGNETMPYDYFMEYNIKTRKATKLSIQNWPEQFRTHGFDIYQESPASDVYIFAVNHKSSGSVVEIFSHKTGQPSMTHIETAEHALIRTPNSVAAIGPRSFYVSNDHYYRKGIMRTLEEVLARKIANVVKWDAGEAQVVIPNLPYPNGLAVDSALSHLYVASSTMPGVYIYELSDKNKWSLQKKASFSSIISPDNIHIDSVTGDVYITGLLNFFSFAKRVKDHNTASPSGTVRMQFDTATERWNSTFVMADDGTLLSTGTAGVPVRSHNSLFFGGAYNKESYHCTNAFTRIDSF